MSRPRILKLEVELTFDEWTAKAAGEDDAVIADLQEMLTGYFLEGVKVKVRPRALTLRVKV